ncbi:hypothetical protein HY501_00355 [Candidatus Woesearchaeota archaeon]|nr:hypothetical protein [Candidatus Woesearchaeota archaeon]
MKFIRLLPDSVVEKHYIRAGAAFGEAISYTAVKYSRFERLLDKWVGWEEEYARRGYRTLSTEEFTSLGLSTIGRRRAEGEKPIFYAKEHKEQFSIVASAWDKYSSSKKSEQSFS